MRIFLLLFFTSSFCAAQSIRIDRLGKEKLVRYNGGISANGVYYSGTSPRQPWSYVLSGNLHFNIAGVYDIPLSFTYSNQKFDFPSPFKFNRLSLHPSYKWVTAHIGDVSMSFSPYTLSGHQFTGVGVDLAPDGPFKISAMYGRFLKATEYDPETPEAITAYRRMGYGVKASYDFENIGLGLTVFRARDEENSLSMPHPAESGLAPKENTVISLETRFTLFEKALFHIEYALSGITEDTRLSDSRHKKGAFSFLLDENISTEYHSAFNASLDYPAGNGSLGVGYERIAPDYRTLGAYYFNNDLENITLNASQTIFDDKLNISVNTGFQRDNLDKEKSSEQQRVVSAVQLNYALSERVALNGSYSNFSTYTNMRDQFDYINQVSEYETLDTLNYRQISQNASFGAQINLSKEENRQRSLNMNLVYQDSKNQQNKQTTEGGASSFYNASTAYTMGYAEKALTVSLAANASYNTIGEDKTFIVGPTLAVGKQFLDKTLRTQFSSSYNTTFQHGDQQGNVYNFRLGGNYTLAQKHRFGLYFLSLFRNSDMNRANDFTATLNYTYTFDNFRLHINRGDRKSREKEPDAPAVRFRYREVIYSGLLPDVTRQIDQVRKSSQFQNIPSYKTNDLDLLFRAVKEQERSTPYKNQALVFLKELYAFEDFLKLYDRLVWDVIKKIKHDMDNIDYKLERRFVLQKEVVDKHPWKDRENKTLDEAGKQLRDDYILQQKELTARQHKVVGHRWMEVHFMNYTGPQSVGEPDKILKAFKKSEAGNVFRMYEEAKTHEEIEPYLELQFIDFFYKQSLEIADPEEIELRWMGTMEEEKD